MLRSRAVQGSFAAFTAVACVLSLASPATGAVGGFGGLLHDQARCCSPVTAGDGIATGVDRPVAGPFAGGRARAPANAVVRGTAPPAGPGRSGAVVSLAQASGQDAGAGEAADARKPEDDPETGNDGAQGTPRALPFDGSDAMDQTFEGSAKPAGPDLTLPEEQQLITGGWN